MACSNGHNVIDSPSVIYLLNDRFWARQFCDLLDPESASGYYSNYRGLADGLCQQRIIGEKHVELERYYSNGKQPALAFLRKLIQIRTTTITLGEFITAATNFQRNDIKNILLNFVKEGKKNLSDLGNLDISKLANLLESSGNSISRNWKDFASHFGLTYLEINNIECSRLGPDIGSPTYALLSVVNEESPETKLAAFINILRDMRRIDAAKCLEMFCKEYQTRTNMDNCAQPSDQNQRSLYQQQISPHKSQQLLNQSQRTPNHYQRPPSLNQQRPNQNQRPPNQNQRPLNQNQQRSNQNQQRPNQNQRPPNQSQRPSNQNQQPPVQNQQPLNQNQQPLNQNQQPPNKNQQPPNKNQQPPIQNQQPLNQNQQPPNQNQQPLNQNQRPPKECQGSLDLELSSVQLSATQKSSKNRTTAPQDDRSVIAFELDREKKENILKSVNKERLNPTDNQDIGSFQDSGFGSILNNADSTAQRIAYDDVHHNGDANNINDDSIPAYLGESSQPNERVAESDNEILEQDEKRLEEPNEALLQEHNGPQYHDSLEPKLPLTQRSTFALPPKSRNICDNAGGLHDTFDTNGNAGLNVEIERSAGSFLYNATRKRAEEKTQKINNPTEDSEYESIRRIDHQSCVNHIPLGSGRKRGLCIIISNYKYKTKNIFKLLNTKSSKELEENVLVDVHTIQQFFNHLNCDVMGAFQNKGATELTDIVESIVGVENYSWLTLFIIARGKNNAVQGTDLKEKSLNEIAMEVQNHFPTIPKFIFAQLFQTSVCEMENTQNPSESEEMLLLISKTKEKISFRKNNKGSYFVQGLFSSLQNKKNECNTIMQVIENIREEVINMGDGETEEIRDYLRTLGNREHMVFKYNKLAWKQLLC